MPKQTDQGGDGGEGVEQGAGRVVEHAHGHHQGHDDEGDEPTENYTIFPDDF